MVQDSDSSYTDHRIGEKLYHYRVRAKDSNGQSAYSNVASGQASFTNEYLGDFQLIQPGNVFKIKIDSDPDSTLNFQRNIRETDLDIEFTLLLDKPGNDFSDPLAEINAGEAKNYPMTYRQLTNILKQTDNTFENEYA